MSSIDSRISSTTNKDTVYHELRDKILSLQLAPGTLISENMISEEYSISRTPVRDIIKILQEEHLVEVLPQIGTKVTQIDTSLISETLFLRYALEKEVFKTLCGKISDNELSELKKSLDLQDFFYQKKMIREFHREDSLFHKLFFVFSNKKHLYDIIQKDSVHYERIRQIRISSDPLSDIKRSIDGHQAMVSILEGKSNPSIISQLFENHILSEEKTLLILKEKMLDSGFFS